MNIYDGGYIINMPQLAYLTHPTHIPHLSNNLLTALEGRGFKRETNDYGWVFVYMRDATMMMYGYANVLAITRDRMWFPHEDGHLFHIIYDVEGCDALRFVEEGGAAFEVPAGAFDRGRFPLPLCALRTARVEFVGRPGGQRQFKVATILGDAVLAGIVNGRHEGEGVVIEDGRIRRALTHDE